MPGEVTIRVKNFFSKFPTSRLSTCRSRTEECILARWPAWGGWSRGRRRPRRRTWSQSSARSAATATPRKCSPARWRILYFFRRNEWFSTGALIRQSNSLATIAPRSLFSYWLLDPSVWYNGLNFGALVKYVPSVTVRPMWCEKCLSLLGQLSSYPYI